MIEHCSARRAEKRRLRNTASTATLALMLALPQAAQAQPEGASEQVVVTGSHLATNGYQAPTPLTVLNIADIQAAAPTNLAEYVAQIPALAGMVSPQSSNASISNGIAGINAVNLRALGVPRTLVLLDGRRSVASTVAGAVDINDFPQALVSRVEVVTGGASAVYGSDAVSGVVNFILDKKYTGIKGGVEGGITDYGDDPYRKFSLTVGEDFLGGRMHVLLSGEYVDRDGIYGVPRKWNDGGNYIITNTAANIAAGQSELLRVSGAGLTSTMGGVINSATSSTNSAAATAALRGIYFGPGGAVGQLQYGSLVRDPWMVGGDWRLTQVNNSQSLDADERRKSLFGRVSYQVTDNFEVYFESAWNKHASLGWTGVQSNLGPTGTTIKADNAFIPASVKTQLQALNVTQFVLATTNINLPIRKTDNDRTVERYTVGFEGTFNLLGTEFHWDGYAQHGVTQAHEVARDITNNARLGFAQDAILVGGQIVCRDLTARANGCVPLNRMGTDVTSAASLAYVLGNPYRKETFEENVGGVNLRFDAFEGWAGPISIATGIEHREESVSGKVPTEFRSGWFVGNYLPNFGYYQVTEGYVETLVPVWEGLDVNAGLRVTGYSTSGTVTTWKVGATYSPIEDVRFRGSISRDIRAPNLNELFVAGTSRSNQLSDPFNSNTNTPFLEITTGNRNLRPEVARNMGIGAVFQPSFAPGLAFSVDYYSIQIKQAIASVDAQTIINRCFQGQTVYCAAVLRIPGGNPPLQVTISGFNGSSNKAQGIDLEGSYSTPVADIYEGLDGDLSFRLMATHFLQNYTNNGVDEPFDTVGQNLGDGPPNWRYRFTATYNNDPWTVSFTGRGISDGVYNNRFVQCTVGCPATTTVHQTINNNHIDGAIYFDLNFTYAFDAFGSQSEAFLGIQNIANADPSIVAYGPAGVAYGNPSTNQQDYDILGRVYRAGIRFRFE